MLVNPSCRLGSSLSSLKTQLSWAPRCVPTPLLSQRPTQSANRQPILTGTTTLRKQQRIVYIPKNPTSVLVRFASSSATSSEPTTTASSVPTVAQPPPPTALTWNDYLALRKTRRRYNLVASIFTSLGTTSVGITVLSQQNFEHLGGMFGLDPFLVLGLATASSGAVGWLLGPFVGNAVFGMVHRGIGGQIAEVSGSISPSGLNPSEEELQVGKGSQHSMANVQWVTQKEKDFYRKIKRYRVDPSSQSLSNPVPDYYGEKIGSVSEFRNWMKDQRAYNKKRQSFL